MKQAARPRVALAFALVYVFWGSTYLGIHIAVERIPPILTAGVRFSIAGAAIIVPAVALVTTAEHEIEPAD